MSEFNSEMKDGWDHPDQPPKMRTLAEFKKEMTVSQRTKNMDAKLNNLIIGSDEDRIAAILVLFRSLSQRGKWILSTKIELSPELYPNIPLGIGQDPNEQPEDNG